MLECRALLSRPIRTGAGELGFSEGVAADNYPNSPSYHNVYVVDIDSYRVEEFSPDNRCLLIFGRDVNASALQRGGMVLCFSVKPDRVNEDIRNALQSGCVRESSVGDEILQ